MIEENRKQVVRSITQDDVAKHAGVSRSIVSYVLNGSPRPVAPETKQRILKAIEELNYRPNKFAQKLMKSSSASLADRQYGVVLSDVFMLRRPYYADILAGIYASVHEKNHHIRFLRFFQDLKDPLLFNELIHKEEISGLMLIALNQSIKSAEDNKLISQIKDRIENIVCVEWELENVSSVNFNRQEAAYKACRHLLSLGHSKIIYIGPDDNRVLGYQQAILETSREYRNYFAGSDLADGFDVCQGIIARGELPDAILGGTDEVSMGILRSLNLNKIDVPKQIALVSIDNIDIAAFTSPPLTTVNVPTAEMGKMAVQILINQASNKDMIVATSLLPTQLIIRESCGSALNP